MMHWIDFIHGDESAFEAIYREYIDDLFAFGVKYHSDRETVLDCIHDLFVNLYNNPKIAKDVQVKFYLFSSLRRRLMRVKKEKDKFQEAPLAEELLWTSSPELEWIKRENEIVNTQRIKKHIEKLPKRQREVLFLKYYMNFSYDEISSMMDVSVESCRTLSYRAIKQLKADLQPLGFGLLAVFKFFI
ncbi:MAG TPA: sigma-70 family RNA polymerase sigma factor [Sphingobacterium sp.]|nr:sigma-70 family RNA polymerase sigma factor [Sphingobacterium sp.]